MSTINIPTVLRLLTAQEPPLALERKFLQSRRHALPTHQTDSNIRTS
jgi:hypothetical protein